MGAYLKSRYGHCSGLSFVDSTKIAICHNKRINRNRVFDGFAKMGKGSMGWFYGFKLHLIVNDRGELLSVQLTKGNLDDRKPLPKMIQNIFGKLFGDKGYISKELSEQLRQNNVQLITSLKLNMKPKLIGLIDQLLLRKRSIIETINDQLKNISQIEHTRHRNPINFIINVLSGLIAYTHQRKKPSIDVQWDTSSENKLFL